MVECSLHPGARKTKRKKANVTAHSSDSTYVRVARRGSNPHSQTSWVPPRCQRLSFGLAVLSGMNYGPLHVHTHPRAAGGAKGPGVQEVHLPPPLRFVADKAAAALAKTASKGGLRVPGLARPGSPPGFRQRSNDGGEPRTNVSRPVQSLL